MIELGIELVVQLLVGKWPSLTYILDIPANYLY